MMAAGAARPPGSGAKTAPSGSANGMTAGDGRAGTPEPEDVSRQRSGKQPADAGSRKAGSDGRRARRGRSWGRTARGVGITLREESCSPGLGPQRGGAAPERNRRGRGSDPRTLREKRDEHSGERDRGQHHQPGLMPARKQRGVVPESSEVSGTSEGGNGAERALHASDHDNLRTQARAVIRARAGTGLRLA